MLPGWDTAGLHLEEHGNLGRPDTVDTGAHEGGCQASEQVTNGE